MQEETKHLVSTNFPKMMGSLVHSNHFLKLFSISMLFLLLLALFTIFLMSFKEPTVIAFYDDGSKANISNEIKMENQVQEAIKNYLEKRYEWSEKDVFKKLKEAESFISPQALNAFQVAVGQVAKFASEKAVSQKLYPEKVDLNFKNGTALITGNRITSIQGLKAVGDLRLELSFEGGSRTKNNPWGIYITKEREE